jgi:hypothetical protein
MSSHYEALNMLNSNNELAQLPEGYEIKKSSLWSLNKDGDWVQLTGNTLVSVIAHVRSSDSKGWGKYCEVADLSGSTHRIAIYNADLSNGGKAAIRSLADLGLTILPDGEKSIIKLIQLSYPDNMYIRANSTGWLDSVKNIFVLPNQVIGNIGQDETVIYEPEINSKTSVSICSKGTVEEWKENVALLAKNNAILIFGILAALSGCLFRILGIDGAGWNLHGHSSRGKTTFLLAASSCWGNGVDPSIDSVNSFCRRWNTTTNALEAIAAAHCDLAICLDELGSGDINNLDKSIYMITGGQGKDSLTSQRSIRATRSWRGNCLSTGEKSFKTLILQSGKNFMAGQMLRMVDIHIDNVLPNPPEGITAAEFAVQLKHASANYYGVAGPAIVSGLIDALNEDREGTIQQLKDKLEEYTQFLTPADASPEQGRVFLRMATIILIGDLGIELDVLPYTIEEVKQSVIYIRDLWLSENNTIADTDRSLHDLQQYLIKNHASFPSTSDPQAKGGNVRAFWNPSLKAYLMTDEQFRAAINGGGEREVLNKLRSLKLLALSEPGRMKVKCKIASAGNKYIRFYAVKDAILELELDGTKEVVTSDIEPIDEAEPEEALDGPESEEYDI